MARSLLHSSRYAGHPFERIPGPFAGRWPGKRRKSLCARPRPSTPIVGDAAEQRPMGEDEHMADTPPTGEPTEEPTGDPASGDQEADAAGSAAEDTAAEQTALPAEPGVAAPQVPVGPEPPQIVAAPPGRGQRRNVRETHTTT